MRVQRVQELVQVQRAQGLVRELVQAPREFAAIVDNQHLSAEGVARGERVQLVSGGQAMQVRQVQREVVEPQNRDLQRKQAQRAGSFRNFERHSSSRLGSWALQRDLFEGWQRERELLCLRRQCFLIYC